MIGFFPHSALAMSPYLLIAASCLDIAIGDPRWLPHPVRIIGKAIHVFEALLRKVCRGPAAERIGGAVLVALIVAPVFLLTLLVQEMLLRFASLQGISMLLSAALMVYLTGTTIAARELVDSARHVLDALASDDIASARMRLSMIVGRDTAQLPEESIMKATIETLAENVSDGVIGPFFYLTLGGLPLAMTYKAINTLDSMVGYKNERYRHMGWASARLDDVANYVPARITGLLIVAASFLMSLPRGLGRWSSARSFRVMLRDGRKHPSPNSGIPEAAYAGALGVVLGGSSSYGGVVVHKPHIGHETAGEGAAAAEGSYLNASRDAVALTKITSLLGICAAAVCAYLWSL
jgi:adenosylcobinamide-phosphate synthase